MPRTTRIAHLSDLHFGRIDPAIVEALRAEIAADPPDLVIASGDLTQSARREEFRAARDFLDGLGAPWLAVPGNHDISPYRLVQRFLDPFGRWRRFVHADTQPDWHNGHVAVVGLNSVRRLAFELDWSHGRLNEEQIASVAERFAALPPHAVRIVVSHHPFLIPPGDFEQRIVTNARAALDGFARAGVALVLCGHVHVPLTARHAAPGAAAEPLIVQGGTATSTRLRGAVNAYNRITAGPDGLHVEARLWTKGAWGVRDAEPATVGLPTADVPADEIVPDGAALHAPARARTGSGESRSGERALAAAPPA